MVAIDFKLCRYHFQQLLFHFLNVLTGRKTRAVGDAENVCIDGNRWPAKGGVEYHIGGFTPDARQCFERGAIFRHFATMFFQQNTAGFNHVFRFAVKQANGFDVLLYALNAQRQHRGWRIGNRVEQRGGFIDADVGRLGGKQHGDQQFKRRTEIEFGGRMWVVFP